MFRRLFAGYSAVLAVAALVLVFTPLTIWASPSVPEIGGLLTGLAVMLVLYGILLRRVLAPVEELTQVMQAVDPLAPGRRIETPSRDMEVAELADAFNGMLDRLERERRDSGRRALVAEEQERRRIARELHDEVGQLLTGLILRGETLARAAPDDLRPELEALRDAARQGAEEVREIAQRLRPESLDELGLQSALLALGTAVQRSSGLVIDRRLERDLPLTAEQELVIYRVAQESLTNVVRHAQAARVELSLIRDDGGVVLAVRDDGVGVSGPPANGSSGIRGMRERALLVGAHLSVEPVAPHGTDVRLRLPAPEPG